MMTHNWEKDIEESLSVLRNGGILLYPTDTIWGIGCDATNEEAVDKIFALKQRPESKSFVVLVADERDILNYIAAPDLSIFNYLNTVTKPTTVIYENAIGLAHNVCSADGSVAIRICKDPFCRQLVKRLRKPIVSTSANISGEPSPQNFRGISERIIKGVDYVTEHRQNEEAPSQPSAIVRWKNGKPEIIRS